MRTAITLLSLFFVSVLALSLLASPVLAQLALPEERGAVFPLPDLALPAAEDGRLVSLADLEGEKYILHVFASW